MNSLDQEPLTCECEFNVSKARLLLARPNYHTLYTLNVEVMSHISKLEISTSENSMGHGKEAVFLMFLQLYLSGAI